MQLLAASNPSDPTAVGGAVQRPGTESDGDIVARHCRGLFRFVRCLGGPRELAEDLVQEAFVVAWRKGKQGLPAPALGAFLRRAARMSWLAQRRDSARGEAAISDFALRHWEAEVADDGDVRLDAARRCVQRLEGRAAQAIDLAYRQERSREQIAAELEMTANGVKTLLARTRDWLEQCIRRNS
ncbi:MAG: sigma-70 family RNA polymerase sigma factor [Planctomycetota bacterium]